MLQHFQTGDAIETAIGEGQPCGIGEHIGPAPVQIAPRGRIVQGQILRAGAQQVFKQTIGCADVQQSPLHGVDSARRHSASQQPLRMQGRTGYEAGQRPKPIAGPHADLTHRAGWSAS